MQEELKRYSTRLRDAGTAPIETRIGVNTGEVVVRSITTGAGHTEYTPIGHTTNLASRVQNLAPAGSIAVTEATQKLCTGYFNFNALGPMRAKGIAQPVNVFELVGPGPLRTRLQRSASRDVKFVGREIELIQMKRALDAAKSGRGKIIAAVAEPGVGKSRLIYRV